jgi:hypothetical protein
MYTDELGRLPLHGQFDFFSQSNQASMTAFDFPLEPLPQSDNHDHMFPANYISSSTFGMGDVSQFSDAATKLPTSKTLMPRRSNVHYRSQDHPSIGVPDQPWRSSLPSDSDFVAPVTIHSDTIAMWSNVPSTFGCVSLHDIVDQSLNIPLRLSDWGMYVSNASVNPNASATASGSLA